MGADKFHPGNPRPILHFHNQPALVSGDVEHHAVVATDTGMQVLRLDVLRRSPESEIEDSRLYL